VVATKQPMKPVQVVAYTTLSPGGVAAMAPFSDIGVGGGLSHSCCPKNAGWHEERKRWELAANKLHRAYNTCGAAQRELYRLSGRVRG